MTTPTAADRQTAWGLCHGAIEHGMDRLCFNCEPIATALAAARADAERIHAEHTVAWEGSGIAWHEVDTEMPWYTSALVAKKIAAGRTEVATLTDANAALRGALTDLTRCECARFNPEANVKCRRCRVLALSAPPAGTGSERDALAREVRAARKVTTALIFGTARPEFIEYHAIRAANEAAGIPEGEQP